MAYLISCWPLYFKVNGIWIFCGLRWANHRSRRLHTWSLSWPRGSGLRSAVIQLYRRHTLLTLSLRKEGWQSTQIVWHQFLVINLSAQASFIFNEIPPSFFRISHSTWLSPLYLCAVVPIKIYRLRLLKTLLQYLILLLSCYLNGRIHSRIEELHMFCRSVIRIRHI